MNGSTFRKVSRIIHLLMAALLGTFIYSPLSSNTEFANFVMWVAIPLVSITGVFMWKQGAIMKAFKKNHLADQKNRG